MTFEFGDEKYRIRFEHDPYQQPKKTESKSRHTCSPGLADHLLVLQREVNHPPRLFCVSCAVFLSGSDPGRGTDCYIEKLLPNTNWLKTAHGRAVPDLRYEPFERTEGCKWALNKALKGFPLDFRRACWFAWHNRAPARLTVQTHADTLGRTIASGGALLAADTDLRGFRGAAGQFDHGGEEFTAPVSDEGVL